MTTPSGSSLQDIKDLVGSKRTHEMREDHIAAKLSSKKDWYQYMGQHR